MHRPAPQSADRSNMPDYGYTRYRSPQPAPSVKVALPSNDYVELSKPDASTLSPRQDAKITPKLLILDLNGALVYRTDSYSKVTRPRPFLTNFLEYLFSPDPRAEFAQDYPRDSRAWEVFIWSSAQPHNVRKMLESSFGRWSDLHYNREAEHPRAREDRKDSGEGELLHVWARDMMGLGERDYRNKVQTYKDIRKVIGHVSGREIQPTSPRARKLVDFDEKRVLLLDDSPLKAIFQPWNQLVIPEFDKQEYQASEQAAFEFRKEPTAPMDGMDTILLAVIGILEELRTIDNVPAWIRAGGVVNIPRSEEGLEDSIKRLSFAADVEPTVENLPSHETFQHWFTDAQVVNFWTKKGHSALQKRGFQVRHDKRVPRLQDEPFRRSSPQRQYSPSRPHSPEPSRPTTNTTRPSVSIPPGAIKDSWRRFTLRLSQDLSVFAEHASLDLQDRQTLQRAASVLDRHQCEEETEIDVPELWKVDMEISAVTAENGIWGGREFVQGAPRGLSTPQAAPQLSGKKKKQKKKKKALGPLSSTSTIRIPAGSEKENTGVRSTQDGPAFVANVKFPDGPGAPDPPKKLSAKQKKKKLRAEALQQQQLQLARGKWVGGASKGETPRSKRRAELEAAIGPVVKKAKETARIS